MQICHLDVHSGYSFMNSTMSIQKIVKGAKKKGFSALALTDKNVLFGAIQFYKECKKEGINPILGMEIEVDFMENNQADKVVVLAMNNEGYRSLMLMSSNLSSNYKGSMTGREFMRYSKNLIVIFPIYQSFLQTMLQKNEVQALKVMLQMQMKFPEGQFYYGIQDHGLQEEQSLNKKLYSLDSSQKLQVVAMQDVRYLDKGDNFAYDCLLAIKEGEKWSPEQQNANTRGRHLYDVEELKSKFGFWQKALQNTGSIAGKCKVTFDFNKRYIPKYPTPNNQSADTYLRKLCEGNISKRYASPGDEVNKRLHYELSIIERMGFSDYFLIVWDFMKYAKEHGILTGPGRGSAAGSLVAYLLYITDVCPLEHELLFERFLNPERVTMPDIDIDFPDVKRDEVISYVHKKYGSDRVAQIITFGTFGVRSVVRDLFKAMEVEKKEVDFLMKYIPQQSESLIKCFNDSKELTNYVQKSEKLKTLFSIAFKLEGLPKHHSTHAAGVIISEHPLNNIVPTIKGSREIALTQYPMEELEQIGLLKMDFLGLKNLSLIEGIVKRIHDDGQKNFRLDRIPMNDKKTYSLLQKGETTGVFQLESEGMRKVLRELGPTEFEDIVAINALYRPGPMEFITNYVKRKHGKEIVKYPHLDLKPILEKTYGVLVYQEQIIKIANKIAGFSLGGADSLRRAVSKKKADVLAKEKENFINGCTKKGYSLEVGSEIYDWIVRFANYGFNRSHAVAYSVISYQLAYLKANYPAHFFAEMLNQHTKDHEKLIRYTREAKDFSIEVLGPSINRSFATFTVEKNKIRMPFTAVKGINEQSAACIQSVRGNKPFKNLFEYCQRVSLKTINKQVIESLILSGAFDEVYSNRATLMASIDQAIQHGELFGVEEGELLDGEFEFMPSYTEAEPFSPIKQLGLEKEVLGMYMSSHPLLNSRPALERNGFLSIDTVINTCIGKYAKGVVALESIKEIRTKKGEKMAFVKLVDETGNMEGTIFPKEYRELSKWIEKDMFVEISGKIESGEGKVQCAINKMSTFKPESVVTEPEIDNRKVYIKFSEKDEQSQFNFIKNIARQHTGETPVIIYVPSQQKKYKLGTSFNVRLTEKCVELLKGHFGNESVVVM